MLEPTVLIADDSAYVRSNLRALLEANGYTVVATAENGVEAIAHYKALRPSVVFLDVIMPQMDGMKALRLLQTLDPDVRAIMLTSISTQGMKADCMNAGALSYILKPFDSKRVLEVLRKVVEPSAPSLPPIRVAD